MEKNKLITWIEGYVSDCNLGIAISSVAQDPLSVADYKGRIRALEHLKESIDEGEFE